MSRLDAAEDMAAGGDVPSPSVTAVEPEPAPAIGPRTVLLEARDVPLGGVRGMSVHRSLPQRELPMVGAWCFLDRFGPQRTRMRVEPHPHIGLQTVTWPLEGEVRHRDAVGSDIVIARGQLNLMTSGAGISHSEYSIGEGEVPLDALQLWVALPESRRHGEPAFERHERLPEVELPASAGPSAAATVVLGEFAGVRSPATAYTPILGAELRMRAGSVVRLPLHPEWEYALVGVAGRVSLVEETAPAVEPRGMLYLGTERDAVTLTAEADSTVFVLGGEPFEDEIVMWWNFVGRSHEEIVTAREEWEARSPRFGEVAGHGDVRIPAPPLPNVRLTRRQRRL